MSLFKTSSERFYTNSILCFVYSALLLDNLLLTAVVPLLPNLIHGSIVSSEEHSSNSKSRNDLFEFFKSSAEHFQRGYGAGENGKLGLLLSLKAVVQLAANPLVAIFTQKVGFSPALLVGNIVFMCSALMFAFGRSYELLAAARAFQGITSACFTVAGLGLTASVYKDELSRSRALGTALGGGAMGVLLGYPFGGMLYQFTGKTIPFLVIVGCGLILFVAFSVTLYWTRFVKAEEYTTFLAEDSQDKMHPENSRWLISIPVGAIFVSTFVMALLETCLPMWLLETMHPEKWQLGVVFIPDSLGYLLTTHLLGEFAYRLGSWKVALVSLLVLGSCCTLVPLASSIIHLTVPHFGIGAGIGAVDAAMVPFLAGLAGDDRTRGKTLAMGQAAVSLAYCLGPLLGGFLVEKIGFTKLMLAVGIINLIYAPVLVLLAPTKNREDRTSPLLKLSFTNPRSPYTQLKNEEDSSG